MNPVQADILVVDDERDLARLVAFNLKAQRHTTRCAHTGEQALAMVAQRAPTLIVLDLMLPDISGKEVCRRLKASTATRNIPIIMLTAADSEVDRVVGFELGAADYVIKPFSTRELTLRVAAVLRRVQPRINAIQETLTSGELEVDLQSHRVRVNKVLVDLTRSEFDLLTTMLRGKGRVYTRDELLDTVWGDSADVLDRTVDAHIMRLRKKLGGASRHVETVRGVGYRVV